ncbi:MAG: AAA family ATPase [Actinomycetota bacterium]
MQILDQRRARSAWLNGARAFHSNNHVEAAGQFERAVTLDEGMADAWLGLHAMGHEVDQAVAAMAKNEHRFGEERQRNALGLDSKYTIDLYVTYRLRDHLDLWGAVAAGHLDRNEHDLAAVALKHTSEESEAGKYLRGRHAFATGDNAAAIIWLRDLINGGDRFLQASARLLSGILLAEAGMIGPAKEHLTCVLRADFIPNAHVSARYWLGIIARTEDDEETAKDYFHRAYAQNPYYPGLQEAVDQYKPQVRIQVARAERVESHTNDGVKDGKVEDSAETVEQVLADLNRQIGQDGIKHQVRALIADTRAQIARVEAGIQQARMTKHFVFTGPPGTGKTTIARVIARLYKALGILEGGHVVEVDRSGLIGQFHGQTVALTKEKLDEAMNGVLFIDEAYTLKTEGFTNGDPFGQEAIDAILKRMEDDRDKFVVIAAGYSGPMQRFLESNPGLRSRFTTTVDFASYSAEELVEIAGIMAEDSGDHLTDEARATLRHDLSAMEAQGNFASDTFGNARYVRTLIEKAAGVRNLRVFGNDTGHTPDRQAMTHLTADDVRAAVHDTA